jgi:hypothetical protein
MLLILVLILVATMFILAAGFLTMKSRERESVTQSRDSFQAHELAFSGLETVRVRLQNDFNFPPATMGPLQEVFKFSETVMNYDNTKVMGRYQIFCDRRWIDGPYEVLRVTSIGQVGDKDGNPVRHKLIGEFSLVTGKKGDLINLLDLGSF